MVRNAPKHYEMQQNLSFVYLGVYRVRSLRKDLMRVRGTIFCINCTRLAHLHRVRAQTKWSQMHQNMKFCINCTSSAHFAPSLVQEQNVPKCTQTLQNETKHEFRVPWCVSRAFAAKSSDATSWHELLH